MKKQPPSRNPRFCSRLPVRRPKISLRLKVLFVWVASAFGLNLPVYALEPGKAWVASWTASPQGPYPAGWPVAQPDLSFALPRGDTDGAADQTFRLIVKPDLWSQKIRLRFSNTFGSRPITLGAVTVGIQSAAGNILSGKILEVQFSGKGEVVLPVGEELYSDEVSLDIDPADPLLEGHKLAVSFFVKGTSGPLTWHTDSLSTQCSHGPRALQFRHFQDFFRLSKSLLSAKAERDLGS